MHRLPKLRSGIQIIFCLPQKFGTCSGIMGIHRRCKNIVLLHRSIQMCIRDRYYANMQRECRRLEHLIENVLSYSRLQRNAIRRARDTLTCQELFEPIAEKIERRLREADISFSFALAQPCLLYTSMASRSGMGAYWLSW